jgi:hypothetical protein
MLLETVFQYRTLIGKCDLGVGLDWDEIDLVGRIEHAFASTTGDGRRYRRQAVEIPAIMRGDHIHDRVELIEIGPGGCVVVGAPFITKDELIELVIDDGEDSYRFTARGVWLRDEGQDYRVGLRFVEMPVKIHRVQISDHREDVVDRINAQAA